MTHHRSRSWFWLIGAFLLSISPAWSQQSLGRIVGQIRVAKGDFAGHPIMVELQLHGAPMNTIFADEQGRFGFYNLEPNSYHVVIRDPAFREFDEMVNVDPLVSSFNMLQVRLELRDEAKPTPSGKGKAGTNPYLINRADFNRDFPKTAVKEFDRGVEADREGKHDAAMQHYQKAIKIAPGFYMAHNNLGSAYLSKSNFAAARSEFQQASRLNQSDGAAYFNLSNVCVLTNELPQAQIYLDQGMQRQPDSAMGHFLQGTIDIRLGRFTQAESSLRTSIQLDPMMAQPRLQLVNLLLQQGRKNDALAQLHDFLSAFPESPFAGRANQLLTNLESPAANRPSSK